MSEQFDPKTVGIKGLVLALRQHDDIKMKDFRSLPNFDTALPSDQPYIHDLTAANMPVAELERVLKLGYRLGILKKNDNDGE